MSEKDYCFISGVILGIIATTLIIAFTAYFGGCHLALGDLCNSNIQTTPPQSSHAPPFFKGTCVYWYEQNATAIESKYGWYNATSREIEPGVVMCK